MSALGPSDEQSDYLVDRLREWGHFPTGALIVLTLWIVVSVLLYDLSRLWLIGGSIGGGAVVLTIFALAKDIVGLGRASTVEGATSEATAREPAP